MKSRQTVGNPLDATAEPAEPLVSLGFKREILLALVLLLLSQAFALTFQRIVRWELAMTSGKPLETPQLIRCVEGSTVTSNPFCQLDCCWYASIIRSGYDMQPQYGRAGDRANWSFFPLFPLFASPLSKVFGMDPTTAAVVASNFALYLAILAFLFMIRSETNSFRETVLAGTLVAFNPAVIYAYGGYPEPLYFALAATGFALIKRRRWINAGLAGGLLSAARPTGIVFLVAYVIAAVRSGTIFQLVKDRRLDVLVGCLLCPVGLSLWMLFMYHRSGDALAWMHMHAAWGVLRSSALSVVWHALAAGGWRRFWAGVAIAGFAISAWLLKKREYEHAVFLALAVLMPLTAEVAGMQRFLLWQPPTLFAAFLFLKRHVNLQAVYFVFAGGMAAAMTLFWFLGNRPFA
jgi:hypothetical protein